MEGKNYGSYKGRPLPGDVDVSAIGCLQGRRGKKADTFEGKGGSHLKREEAPARVHGGGDEGDRLVVEKAAVGVRGSRGMYLRAGRKM